MDFALKQYLIDFWPLWCSRNKLKKTKRELIKLIAFLPIQQSNIIIHLQPCLLPPSDSTVGPILTLLF